MKITPKGGCVMCELDVCAHKGSAMKDILKGGCKIALGIALFVGACEAICLIAAKLER